MGSPAYKLQHRLDNALTVLAKEKGEDLARRIKPILLANLDRGRIDTYLDGDPSLLPSYVRLIAQTYSSLNPYLHQLQIEQSHETWEPLFERMQTWAYNYLLRKNFPANANTRDAAVECAAEAATNLLNAHFPYDTKFDAWAHVIVLNACRKYIGRLYRKSEVPDGKLIELEAALTHSTDLLVEEGILLNESGEEILEALNQLSEARRTVIVSIYFEDRKPPEIAKKLGKSVGAVYSLHFNALEDLRKILGTIRDKLNE